MPDYDGEMRLDGAPVHFRSARDALAAGIGMVHQELSVVPDLTRRRERLSRHAADRPARHRRLAPACARAAAEQLRRPRHRSSTRAPRLGALPIGLQQLVELARVLFSGARIIILDEPTSALSPPEIERLFGVLRRLRDEGHSIIFISHFLDDVLKIADPVTVFRNGRKVVTAAARRDRQALDHRAHDRHGP